jgi:dihydroorotate dehydrogenase
MEMDALFPFGASIGKQSTTPIAEAIHDHEVAARAILPYVKFLELGLSSPNTKNLRELLGKQFLRDNIQVVHGVMDEMGIHVPLVIKISPDEPLQVLDDITEVAIDEKVDAIAATNTTINPEIKRSYGGMVLEKGGVAGDDPRFRRLSTGVVAYVYSRVKDSGIDVWGVGGVKNDQTALEKIKAGAKVVQTVTGIRTSGPFMASRTNIGLVRTIEQDGVKNISEYVGVDYKKYL